VKLASLAGSKVACMQPASSKPNKTHALPRIAIAQALIRLIALKFRAPRLEAYQIAESPRRLPALRLVNQIVFGNCGKNIAVP
jgi:hypothetical protein